MYAQPGFGDDVSDAPIDGGLSLLIAAGAGLSYQKRKRNNNNKKADYF
jgi:hypothetical protein